MKTVIIKNTWLNGMEHGWGNGYVLIPEGHILHGKHYDDIDVNIHGGLTFSGLIDEQALVWGKDILTKDDIGMWMIGFDTAHYSDTMSKWPEEKVQAEADRLLAQVINYK